MNRISNSTTVQSGVHVGVHVGVHAGSALMPEGWRHDVRILVENGRIASIQIGIAAAPEDERVNVLVPGMCNLHSHAFQRGMAGLAEVGGPACDHFWSWRNAMYHFALTMTPDDVEAVASQLYMEMLEAGFCRVGEFHYLHHDRDGKRYANIAEMAERIAAAADHTGIGLTLLPVFYAHSGFGGIAPLEGQRRFISDLDGFEKLLIGCREAVRNLPGAIVGVAPHSLRAVTPDELSAVIAMATDGPIHIHAAEQTKEIQDCMAWSGARPVEWLLDHVNLDARWCLIHATHLHADETRRLAQSGAVAGLCPITEANLGDGIFPTQAYLAAGGRFGIGSDSNILIGISDELRQLEYAQRLLIGSRNVLAQSGQSSGRILFENAVNGGGIALASAAGLVVGNPADFVSLTTSRASHLKDDAVLDAWIFTNAIRPDCVWASGVKLVTGGQHISRAKITPRFDATMRTLDDKLSEPISRTF